MRKQYLETGKIINTHGIRGEVKIYPWCDSPDDLMGLETLYLEEGRTALEVERAFLSKNTVVMKFRGIDQMEDALTLRNKVVYLNRDDLSLEEGTYFIQDLLGFCVKDADSGKVYGTLSQVSNTGASDLYHITAEDGREYMLPAVPAFVVKTDLEAETILVRPIPGLLDDGAVSERE